MLHYLLISWISLKWTPYLGVHCICTVTGIVQDRNKLLQYIGTVFSWICSFLNVVNLKRITETLLKNSVMRINAVIRSSGQKKRLLTGNVIKTTWSASLKLWWRSSAKQCVIWNPTVSVSILRKEWMVIGNTNVNWIMSHTKDTKAIWLRRKTTSITRLR